jgi:acetylornithine deacetylase/succinyl-diaminopimelate desuccinylase-like protein
VLCISLFAGHWRWLSGYGSVNLRIDNSILVSPYLTETCIAGWALDLIKAASPNPPGRTREAAEAAARIISEAIPGAELNVLDAPGGVTNLLARVKSGRAGKRVVFNGHLDTYPVLDPASWSKNPAGEVVGERLYGRGAADMKGGIAASIAAFSVMASVAPSWSGEIVLSLAGDEESMGPLGTDWLMRQFPYAVGDAAIIGDAGSPRVVRFGEKGFLWIDIEATGKSSHGAHVHLGVNAIDRLRVALNAVTKLETLEVHAPDIVLRAIGDAKPISEALGGNGEADTLSRITINIGRIEGGSSANLVPNFASAKLDIRLPVGVSCAEVEQALAPALDLPGIEWRVQRRFEPNYTPPDSALVQACEAAARAVTGEKIAVNMRVGGSDARWFPMAGIPTVVYGPTPFNMGASDEYALIPELMQVAKVHALTALSIVSEE